jgi:hypothetical protein
MKRNTKARSEAIAAKAKELVSKTDFQHQRIHPILLTSLYAQLAISAQCSHSTAVRHIKASLGLTDPIGRLKIAFPVQRFNYRATDEEAKAIKAKLGEYVEKLLRELRGE